MCNARLLSNPLPAPMEGQPWGHLGGIHGGMNGWSTSNASSGYYYISAYSRREPKYQLDSHLSGPNGESNNVAPCPPNPHPTATHIPLMKWRGNAPRSTHSVFIIFPQGNSEKKEPTKFTKKKKKYPWYLITYSTCSRFLANNLPSVTFISLLQVDSSFSSRTSGAGLQLPEGKTMPSHLRTTLLLRLPRNVRTGSAHPAQGRGPQR